MVHSRKNYIAIIFDNKKKKESRDRKKRRYFMKKKNVKTQRQTKNEALRSV